ncbi:unnamed protein product [Polarella glacialis]|uniref:Uncharacterized protein n=1 Tax=Polarella glacialis TaxID=89957 RepID=A0A813LYT1_POLGL|nr:unnamed protein product [Polarella glacialis]
MISSAVDIFTKRLTSLFDFADGVELLRSDSHGSYIKLEEVVEAGESLEHFHTYGLPTAGSSGCMELTMDHHVDQGLFIAFVPAMLVDDVSYPSDPGLSIGDVMIKSRDGEELRAEFQPDSLMILVGDDVKQYLHSRHHGLSMHAPVHAFRMPKVGPGLHRVWYGMMQLPPADATNEETGLIFGEVRAKVMGGQELPLGLGCSRNLAAPELQATCNQSQIYCWHQCVDFTATLNTATCAAAGSGYNCTNQFDEIYQEKYGHGDYNPACINSTAFITPRPTVQQTNGTCSGWEDLVSDAYYANRVALVAGETYFLWNVVGGNVEGKMIHKGLVGWMAIGIENVGGGHFGMNGGRVVMGLNNPATSLSIGEYKIDEALTAFRH